MTRKIGIFGGSFNPPHVGHVRAAIEAREALGLDMVEMTPVCLAPHKCDEGMLPAEVRARLLELCIKGVPGLRLCDIELRRTGPSYTIDTLRQYAAENPGSEIFFIMGVNDLLNLPHWKDGTELGFAANLVVLPRDGLSLAEASAFLDSHAGALRVTRESQERWRFDGGFGLVYVDIPRLDVNASLVRDKWRRGACLDGLVPPLALAELSRTHDLLAARWGGGDDR